MLTNVYTNTSQIVHRLRLSSKCKSCISGDHQQTVAIRISNV